MTLVESTAVAVLNVDEATELTNRIRQTGSVLWTQIVKAYQGRAWSVLGYESWDDYCNTEFDGAQIKLPREDRTMVVASLADAGMSTRAIAAATGVDPKTVRNDMQSGGEYSPPETNVAGEQHPSQVLTPGDSRNPDVEPPEPRKVTGIDGKTYNVKPKPPTQRRPSISGDLVQIGAALQRATERIQKIETDDRFYKSLTPQFVAQMALAVDVCTPIINTHGGKP